MDELIAKASPWISEIRGNLLAFELGMGNHLHIQCFFGFKGGIKESELFSTLQNSIFF